MVKFFQKISEGFKDVVAKQKMALEAHIREVKRRRAVLRAQNAEKFRIVDTMTNTELLRVVRNFITTSPKITFTNAQGKKVKRAPKRNELIDAILKRVSLENIFDSTPRIKRKFRPSEKIVPLTKKKSVKKKLTKKKTKKK